MHHGENVPFLWGGPLPGMDEGATPDRATEVTLAQVEAFLRRVAEECPGEIVKASPSEGEAVPSEEGGGEVTVDVSGLAMPPLTRHAGVVIRDRRVVDGREAYVWGVCRAIVRLNRTTCTEAQLVALAMSVMDRDLNYDEDRSREDVLEMVEEKVPRVLAHKRKRVAAGKLPEREGIVTARGADRQDDVVPHALQAHDADLDALLPGQVGLKLPTTPVDEGARAERALLSPTDREVQSARVKRETRDPIVRWLDAVWDEKQGERKVPEREMVALRRAAMEVVLLLGPTGSGKTTTLLRCVKEQIDRRGRIGPILFMAPSYALLKEVSDRAGGLAEAAEEAATLASMREAEGLGLRVMTYQGKGRLCLRPEGRVVSEARMSLGHMCESTVRERRPGPGETWHDVHLICPHKEDGSCPAWAQLAQVMTSDIVFLPTAYVSLPVPKELKACVALVVDESVAGRFLRSDSLALSSLGLPRREPILTKREKAEGKSADEMTDIRREVNGIIHAAALRSVGVADAEDIAATLLDATWHDPRGEGVDPIAQVTVARNVVGRAADTHRQVRPDMTLPQATLLAGRESATDLWGEWHLHGVLVERMGQLRQDRLDARTHAEALANGFERPAPTRSAKGRRDARLQVVRVEGADGAEPTVRIRVSWRAKNSFEHLPTMLMDASASVKMIEKLWHGREVRQCHAPARMHLRVLAVVDRSYSDSSLLPWRHQSEARRQAAATLHADVRRVVDMAAGMWGYSQVLLASTKGVEVAMHTGWRPPVNVSWLHYGAVVGLNFAERYPAAVIVGRQELPHAAIDALVGALAYDDEDPERPVDYLGTGMDAEGRDIRTPMVDRAIRLRSGADVIVQVPEHVGKWARIVQRQAREEQLRQAIGRLRPVYREGEAPLAIVLGTCLPEDLVVDAVCGMSDLRQPAGLYATARVSGGVVTTDVTIHGLAVLAKPNGHTLSPSWSDMTHRHLAGFARHRYRREDGTEHQVDVLATVDPVDAIAGFEAMHAREWDLYRGSDEVARGRPLDGLRPREPDDKMLKLVGTPADQAAAALRVREAVVAASRPKALGPDGTVLRTLSGHEQVVTFEVADVLVALASRPVPGLCVNAAPVMVIEEPVQGEPANPAPVPTIGAAWAAMEVDEAELLVA